jgi:hypothetical protein
MRRHHLALLATVPLLISGVGTTAANAQEQAVQQAAGNSQTATSNSSTTQYQPSNSNIDVRIGSPGSNGSVTQVNQAGSAAVAGNANSTGQTATQQGGGTQAAGQSAGSAQDAGAATTTNQVKPSNENISVRIGSDGANGPVTQSNSAGSVAAAGNINGTTQTADQQQAGGSCKCHGGGEQIADQGAENDQTADAEATTQQIKPSNSNISVRIGSPGPNGSVDQSNVADSIAAAGNANVTDQSATQSGGGGGEQAAGQDAKSGQTAGAGATTTQKYPSNDNTSVRIGSPGEDGDVTQTNAAGSGAIAGNLNWTGQTVDQSQGDGCGCHGGTGVQGVGQWADSEQDATADSTTTQTGASNSNTPVRIGSAGPSGDVTQINAAGSGAIAVNGNGTEQAVTQSGGGVQAVGQWADNDQSADATSTTDQWKPSNANTPVAVGGGGHDCGCHAPKTTMPAPSGGGDVTQINAAGSLGIAGNLNVTSQTVEQSHGGGDGHAPAPVLKQDDGCGCHGGTGVQAVGQWADSDQDATADSTTTQAGASNTNAGGAQGGGDVTQANLAGSLAAAGNANIADQSVSQTGGSGGGVQAAEQWPGNDQTADATSTTEQKWPSNANGPVAIGGGHAGHGCGCPTPKSAPSGGGDVTQVNAAGSLALAGNLNWTGQSVDQSQGGDRRCTCHGGGEQSAGQWAGNTQGAYASADTTQWKPSNTNTPVAIGGGKGGHDQSRSPYGTEPTPQPRAGSVTQANLAFSHALSLNLNWLTQEVTQDR